MTSFGGYGLYNENVHKRKEQKMLKILKKSLTITHCDKIFVLWGRTESRTPQRCSCSCW